MSVKHDGLLLSPGCLSSDGTAMDTLTVYMLDRKIPPSQCSGEMRPAHWYSILDWLARCSRGNGMPVVLVRSDGARPWMRKPAAGCYARLNRLPITHKSVASWEVKLKIDRIYYRNQNLKSMSFDAELKNQTKAFCSTELGKAPQHPCARFAQDETGGVWLSSS